MFAKKGQDIAFLCLVRHINDPLHETYSNLPTAALMFTYQGGLFHSKNFLTSRSLSHQSFRQELLLKRQKEGKTPGILREAWERQ
jgi:hypothetical protein